MTDEQKPLKCRSCGKPLEILEALYNQGWPWCRECFKKLFPERMDIYNWDRFKPSKKMTKQGTLI